MAAAHGRIRRGLAHDDEWDGWLVVDSPRTDRSRSRSPRGPRGDASDGLSSAFSTLSVSHGPARADADPLASSSAEDDEQESDENMLVPWLALILPSSRKRFPGSAGSWLGSAEKERAGRQV